MKMKLRNQILLLLGAILLTVGLAPTSSLAAQGKVSAVPAKKWRAKYLDGTESITRKQKIRMTLEGERLECVAGKSTLFYIPVARITQVDSLNDRANNALLAGLKTAGSVTGAFAQSAGGDPSSAALAIEYLFFGFVPTAGISALVHTRDSYAVTIGWEEDSESHQATLEMGPREYDTYLSALQRATGKSWLNLRVEERRLRSEHPKSLTLEIPRAVRVERADLRPGLYQVVLLEDKSGQAEVLFVRGRTVNRRKIAAIAPAEICAASGDASAPPASYVDEQGVTRISELRIAGKTVRLKPSDATSSKPDEERARQEQAQAASRPR